MRQQHPMHCVHTNDLNGHFWFQFGYAQQSNFSRNVGERILKKKLLTEHAVIEKLFLVSLNEAREWHNNQGFTFIKNESLLQLNYIRESEYHACIPWMQFVLLCFSFFLKINPELKYPCELLFCGLIEVGQK